MSNSKYSHISPDGRKRKCKNPAKCPFRVVQKENNYYLPKNMDTNKKRQIRRFHASGLKVSFMHSIQDVASVQIKKKKSEDLEKSSHSDIDFLSEDINVSKDDILRLGNPLKI